MSDDEEEAFDAMDTTMFDDDDDFFRRLRISRITSLSGNPEVVDWFYSNCCEECGLVRRDIVDFEEHMRHECYTCPLLWKSRSIMEKHYRQHNPDRK